MKYARLLLPIVIALWGLCSHGADISMLERFGGMHYGTITCYKSHEFDIEHLNVRAMFVVGHEKDEKGHFMEFPIRPLEDRNEEEFEKIKYSVDEIWVKIPMEKMTDFFTNEKVRVENGDGIEEMVGFQGISSSFDERGLWNDSDALDFIPFSNDLAPGALRVFQFKFMNGKLSSLRIQRINPKTRDLHSLIEMRDITKPEARTDWHSF